MADLDERAMDTLRMLFRQDSGVVGDPVERRAAMTPKTEELVKLLADGQYHDGPKNNERWFIAYHGVMLGTAKLTQNHQRDLIASVENDSHFSEMTAWVDGLCRWAEYVFEKTFCDKKACVGERLAIKDKIPWEHVAFVHELSGRGLDAILTQYRSFIARQTDSPKRKRCGTLRPHYAHKRVQTVPPGTPECADSDDDSVDQTARDMARLRRLLSESEQILGELEARHAQAGKKGAV